MYVIVYGPGGGFPNGPASASRTILYALGLQSVGENVLVLCPGPSEYPEIGILNNEIKGSINGINFEYTCGTTIRGKNIFHQKWLVIKGLVKAALKIFFISRTSMVKGIILYSDRVEAILLYWVVSKICKSLYIFERCEQPFYKSERSLFWRVISQLYSFTFFRLFDGVFVISDHLWKFMQERLPDRTKLLKVPILVDFDQFSLSKSKAPIPGKYIAYCGRLIESKDGVSSLIKAYSMICDEFPKVNLVIIGDSIKESRIPVYRRYSNDLGICEKVIFTGLVTRSELPSYLCNAEVLVLSRPTSLQAEAGFPTKLGEYLATGKPVLVTETGELNNYLQDRINIYFSPADNIFAFTERLKHILSHPKESFLVGQNGQKVAQEQFDYKKNGQRIKGFLDQLYRYKNINQ